MKNIIACFGIICLFTLVGAHTNAQQPFPNFLEGTWKMENKEVYEHWNTLPGNRMKGFSYKMKDGMIAVSEYLDLVKTDKGVIYTATVLNQNEGKGIEFKLTQSDTIFSFENPAHDFPKKISYQKISDHEIFVNVSDGKQKGFSYTMKKSVKSNPINVDSTSNPSFDKELAVKFGADDFGMKSYIFVILKTGSNSTDDKNFINNAFRGHLINIGRLVDEGKLTVAGPLGKNENNYRGIFILNVSSVDEARELLQTDPAIHSELLQAEIYSWYGSAALPAYLGTSDKIWKTKP